MKKTVFEVRTESIEERMSPRVNLTEEDIWDIYNNKTDYYPVVIGQCDTLEDARAAFKTEAENRVQSYYQAAYGNGWLLIATLVWIEENEIDEDGEYDNCSGVWDYSAEPITLDEDEDIGE